ncbi:Lectin-domain containing receptor kinase VI.3 [Senna tora]|uniref:Lectin-domain containing receptor kinase VI.3 n=1 Tax=Senna tora TaxID=362788 RepID=A0A834XIV7_9FABA|nr:Lectin-domain containing receptor kinase VI.3 [Senna tora]
MAASSSSSLSLLFLFLSLLVVAAQANFVLHGFEVDVCGRNLTCEGVAVIRDKMLKLTNRSNDVIGSSFYKIPFPMLDTQKKVSSFSTSFVFSIVPSTSEPGGFGLAFTIAPKTSFSEAESGHFLGLFNSANNGVSSNHIFAVEFDTVDGSGQGESDKEGNEVGVNINGLTSTFFKPAGYFNEHAQMVNFSMEESDAVQAWIDYDGGSQILNVTIAPYQLGKPSEPLISNFTNLTGVLNETMYVGFSASTGEAKASSHYILGWSFSMNGPARSLDISKLPDPPSKEKDPSSFPWVKVAIGFLSSLTLILLFSTCFLTLYKRYKSHFETLEDWELDCPHRFKYRDLHTATKGFKQSELIGSGGFGAVYKGVLPTTGTEVAVKKIFRSPIHGMREFAAEIESLGRLRHKNLINLQGWSPELTRTGKASTSSDVYAYGVLLLEVATGRRPIGGGTSQFFLVDWVVENQNLGQILEVVDPKLNSVYDEEEVELVLKLGLLCAQHNADSRPTMRQVTRYLNFDDPLPEIGGWRRNSDSESSRMSFGFLEIVSTSSISTSQNLSSCISMNNSKTIEAGR